MLALAPAIGLGIGRFAYSLVLPDMRDSLQWSYSAAGFMNTVNAAGYLAGALGALPRLEAILALGRIAHDSVARALDLTPARLSFGHGARHALDGAGLVLFDSYHCSRYNTNTGVLTPEMFRAVFAAARAHLG